MNTILFISLFMLPALAILCLFLLGIAVFIYSRKINTLTRDYGRAVLSYQNDTTANILEFYDKYFKDYRGFFRKLFWSGGRWQKVLPPEAHEYFQKTLNYDTLIRELKKCSQHIKK